MSTDQPTIPALRIRIITALIHLNEYFIFYRRLRKFYKKQLKTENPVIFDVGSNKGQTIDFFLKLYPNCIIYSFEPNGDLYRRLCKKYKNNSNIILNNCGVSDQSGTLLFKETVTSETSTFEELNYDSDYLKMKSKVLGVKPEQIIKKSYEVEVLSLSNFINSKGIGHIDVLKIDTEGHEYKCLLGLFTNENKANIALIQLEHHNDDMYANKVSGTAITKLLNDNNFCLFSTIKHGFGDFDEVIYSTTV